MKRQYSLALLALAPALWAAEPKASAPVATALPLTQEEIADRATLVQQIGEEASRGLDAEAHARALRAQMESLVATSRAEASGTKGPSSSVAVPKMEPVKSIVASPPFKAKETSPSEASIREALRKLRSAVDELDARLDPGAKH